MCVFKLPTTIARCTCYMLERGGGSKVYSLYSESNRVVRVVWLNAFKFGSASSESTKPDDVRLFHSSHVSAFYHACHMYIYIHISRTHIHTHG